MLAYLAPLGISGLSKTRTLSPGKNLKVKLEDIGFDEDNGVTTLVVQNNTGNAESYTITVVVV